MNGHTEHFTAVDCKLILSAVGDRNVYSRETP